MLNVNDSGGYNAVQQESSVLVAGVTWLLSPAFQQPHLRRTA